MSQDPNTVSTTIRLRLPRQLLAVIEEWSTAHDLPRSTAAQQLLLRGLAWDEARQQQQQLAASDRKLGATSPRERRRPACDWARQGRTT
jgi:hypothetical protein